jgi:hypothetical protein
MKYQFIDRIYHYPIVYDTCCQVAGAYSTVRSHNRLTEGACHLAESCASTAAAISAPVIDRFDQHLSEADGYGCRQLNELEYRYPILLKPSCDVIHTTKECVQGYTNAQNLVEPIASRLRGAQNAAGERGAAVIATVDQMVEKYVPSLEVDDEKNTKEDADEAARQKAALFEQTYNLIVKIRDRIMSRAQRRLQNCAEHQADTIKRLSDAALIREIRKAYEDFHAKYVELEQQSRKEEVEYEMRELGVNGDAENSGKKERADSEASSSSCTWATGLGLGNEQTNRLVASFQALESTTRHMLVSYATIGWNVALALSSTTYNRLPDEAQQRLTRSWKHIKNLTECQGGSDAKESSEKTSGITSSGQHVLSLLQYILLSPVNWLSPVRTIIEKEEKAEESSDAEESEVPKEEPYSPNEKQSDVSATEPQQDIGVEESSEIYFSE